MGAEVKIKRLPPGPEPEVPFIDQVRTAPRFACRCGNQRRYWHGDESQLTGRCYCWAGLPATQSKHSS
jgi:hypothetical protein